MRYKTNKRYYSSAPAFRLTAVFVAAVWELTARANPQGMSVVSGSAVARTTGPHLELNVSPVTILDWHSFNIGVGETTRFIQPSVDSIVFNRIGDINPSQIFGNLSANGTVILANQNGFYFGPNSVISVGNLIATTSPSLPDFGSGGAWQFTGLPPLASIVNYGKIQTPSGGSVYLIAEQIANHGLITTPKGSIGLFAGKEVLVSERPDGRGLSAAVRLPAGSVDNTGKLIADAGAISLHAQVVNQTGLVQANTVRERNGHIELVAAEALNLAASSEVLAEGGSGTGTGGDILLKSEGAFHDEIGSRVSVAGGATGGSGGSVELSAPQMNALNSQLDARAQAGFAFGNLLLDPTDIILDKTGTGAAPGGVVPVGTPGTTLRLNVNTAFRNFSTVTLQATRDITLAASTVWNLYDSTGKSEPGCLLTLQAGRNIVFGNSSSIIDSTTDPEDSHWQGLWSVKLQAGYDFSQKVVNATAGGIYLSGGPANGSGVIPTGSGSIELYRGSISLEAAADLLVGSGFIRTVGGGDIYLRSVNGDVNAGTRNDNFQFSARGYEVSQKGLGGIATAHGGDIEIRAGRNMISDPKKPAAEISPGAVGAYGAEPGDVSLSAGGDILGNFLVRNGMGKITADGNAGTVKKPLTLSLISGSWDVTAGNDIVVTEVRNPQGTFNSVKLPVPAGQWIGNIDDDAVPQRLGFLFDYALDSSVKFTAANSVTLLGENLPRINKQNENMKPVYPPSLEISAGAGGIEIDSTITLFPSPQGSLSLVTHDGGDLRGQQIGNSLTGIIMSDSGLPAYTTFASGHALAPLHLQDHHPVQVAINGGVQNFLLSVPKAATIDVRKDAYNFGFLGQNLAGADVTSISIGQSLTYRGFITEVPLGDVPNPAVLDPVQSTNPDLAQKLFYNAQTGKLGFRGQMSDQDLRFLLDPTVYALDSTGQVMLDYLGNPTEIPARFTADVAGLQSLFEQTQTASLGDQGLALGGPGTFRIVARNIDLGISGGIQTLPANKALVPISPYGAALEVSVLEDLNMSSTKIASLGINGPISIVAGGKIDVGSQATLFGDPDSPKGIYSASGGDITVLAKKDININGSRIAAYNGGDISVTSLEGDLNAGAGGAGFVGINALEIDPLTHEITAIDATIPGSGVLATALPGSAATVGNIRVATPNGSIRANIGGVIQLAFNDSDSRNSSIELTAGKDIDAGASGVIGSNLRLDAKGSISGLVFSSGTLNIRAVDNVNVQAVALQGVQISAGGTVGGSVVSAGAVSVSADAISASLGSKNVSTSGDSSAATVNAPTAAAKSDSKVTEDASSSVAKADTTQAADDEELKKKKALPVLSRSVGRVTVILPKQVR